MLKLNELTVVLYVFFGLETLADELKDNPQREEAEKQIHFADGGFLNLPMLRNMDVLETVQRILSVRYLEKVQHQEMLNQDLTLEGIAKSIKWYDQWLPLLKIVQDNSFIVKEHLGLKFDFF